eukprot:2712369-Prymnesium_polylepis.1
MSTRVYPCAKHSRFEHSLGVAHLAGEFLRQVQRCSMPNGISPPSDRDILWHVRRDSNRGRLHVHGRLTGVRIPLRTASSWRASSTTWATGRRTRSAREGARQRKSRSRQAGARRYDRSTQPSHRSRVGREKTLAHKRRVCPVAAGGPHARAGDAADAPRAAVGEWLAARPVQRGRRVAQPRRRPALRGGAHRGQGPRGRRAGTARARHREVVLVRRHLERRLGLRRRQDRLPAARPALRAGRHGEQLHAQAAD